MLLVALAVLWLASCGWAGDEGTAEVGAAGATHDDTVTASTLAASTFSDQAGGRTPARDEDEDAVADGDRAPVGVISLTPRPVGESVAFTNGLEATVTRIDPVDVDAIGPGETSGPGVLVAIDLTSNASEPVDLISVAVSVTGPDGEPAIPTRSGEPFEGVLQPGETAAGTYVFRVDGDRSDIAVDIYHGTSESVVVVHS